MSRIRTRNFGPRPVKILKWIQVQDPRPGSRTQKFGPGPPNFFKTDPGPGPRSVIKKFWVGVQTSGSGSWTQIRYQKVLGPGPGPRSVTRWTRNLDPGPDTPWKKSLPFNSYSLNFQQGQIATFNGHTELFVHRKKRDGHDFSYTPLTKIPYNFLPFPLF